jgi:hypothetical protein
MGDNISGGRGLENGLVEKIYTIVLAAVANA